MTRMASLGFHVEKKNRVHKLSIMTNIIEEEQKVEPQGTPRNNLWMIFSIGFSILISVGLCATTSVLYSPREPYIVPTLIVISIVIAALTWLRTMLSMNLVRRSKRTRTRVFSIVLYSMASICYFSSSLAVMQKNWTLQFITSLSGSIIGWIAFITVFEGDFVVPSKQQLGALVQILVLSFLWESRTFVVNMHFENVN